MSKNIRALKSQIDVRIRDLIKQGTIDGSIRECDAKIASFALAGAMNWIAYWHDTHEALPSDQLARGLANLFAVGIARRATR